MNVQLNPNQSNTKHGVISYGSATDLTGKENLLVKLQNNSGVAQFALPGSQIDLALYVVASGDVAAGSTSAEQPGPEGNFRVKLHSTCHPADVLILSDPTASAGVNAGKVEAIGATAGQYFSIGTAEESGVDGQSVLCRYLPRIVQVKGTFQVAAPATTAASNSSPYGFTTQLQADAIQKAVNDMRTQLVALGLMS